jgi:hypothetical protein
VTDDVAIVNPVSVPGAQRADVEEDIGFESAPEIVVLHFGLGTTTISAGSELSPGVVSQLLATVAIFEIVPVAVVATFTDTVISGYFAPDETILVEVHVIGEVVLQLHPVPFGVPLSMTPVGRVSVTVLVPVEDAGPLFVTRIT